MKHAPHLSDQKNDIQAIVGSGFGWLTCSRFYLLTVKDAALARQWIAQLIGSGLVRSVGELSALGSDIKSKVDEVAAIAFSYGGLHMLGLTESRDFPFSTAFRSGMGSDLRQALLRDSPREHWHWDDTGNKKRQTAHILLAHWSAGAAVSKLPAPDDQAFVVRCISASPDFFRDDKLYEPFGFRDGIAQPVIYGLKEERNAASPEFNSGVDQVLYRDRIIAPGEFILGYRNEYDELTYSPDVAGWKDSRQGALDKTRFGLNGSYLAVREIDQDVAAFKEFDVPLAAPSACPLGVTIAEKLMGRRKDDYGTPLGWTGTGCPLTDSEADAFRYRVDDANGFLTPRGSHIRRVNPRDTLGHDVQSGIKSAKLHRLLRRGRPYCEVLNSKGNDGKADVKEASNSETVAAAVRQGLFFIAINADLERQFEFIYQRWLRNPRFAGLENEDDPILGTVSGAKRFAVPALPLGESTSLKSFTTTRGGGYFFLPGLKALKFIAGCELQRTL